MGPAVVPKEPSMVSKPHYKAKQTIRQRSWTTGSSVTPMPPYLSLPSIVTVLSELYRVMRKLSGKADLAICSYSVVVSG